MPDDVAARLDDVPGRSRPQRSRRPRTWSPLASRADGGGPPGWLVAAAAVVVGGVAVAPHLHSDGSRRQAQAASDARPDSYNERGQHRRTGAGRQLSR